MKAGTADTAIQLTQKQEPRQIHAASPQLVNSRQLLMMPLYSMKSFLEKVTLGNPYLTPADDDLVTLCGGLGADGADARESFSGPPAGSTLAIREELLADGDESLQTDLMLQAQMLDISASELRILRCLIAALDGDGYLREDDASLGEAFGCAQSSVRRSREALQTLTPKGVGARDLRECLLLQTDPSDPDCRLARDIIENDLELLAKKRYRDISVKRHAPAQSVERACALIRAMEPRPGAGYSQERTMQYIYPDACIKKKSCGYELSVAGSPQSIIRYDPDYMKGVSDESAVAFLRQKKLEAMNLIHSIEMRHTIIRRLLELIMIEQRDFFLFGPNYIRPFMMKSAAARLNVSASTVTRCVQDKYIDTPLGLFPFSFFFQQPSGSSSTGPVQIKQSLKNLIANESESDPLSDDDLRARLSEQGVELSQRTVSKYREQLGIPGKRERLRLFNERIQR